MSEPEPSHRYTAAEAEAVVTAPIEPVHAWLRAQAERQRPAVEEAIRRLAAEPAR